MTRYLIKQSLQTGMKRQRKKLRYSTPLTSASGRHALKEAQISAVEGVFLADNVVSDDLRLKLSSGLKRLENVPNDQKEAPEVTIRC